MLDADGKLAGAWYVGYRLDSIAGLGKSIQGTTILDNGFLALVKPTGEVIFHGSRVTDDAFSRIRQNPEGWNLNEVIYPAWGYKVLTTYPESDVTHRQLKIAGFQFVGVAALVALIMVLQFVLLGRQVLVPVRHLTERLSNADLNTLLEADYNDEIGDLAAGFNRFVLRLRQTLLQVRDGSEATSEKTGTIRTVSHNAVARMTEQSRAAEDASQSAAQLSRSIEETSSHTDEASEHARSAAEAARLGGEQVATAVTLIQGLSESTQQSASRVATLTDRTRQIGSIVGVIEEIAAGTNLLALNASIEAARAGEHGRGFAVVAGEVRRLAERTAQATHQVADLVSGIEQETSHASRGILTACEHAGHSAKAVSALSDTFSHIAAMVIEVEQRMEQIAKAGHQEAVAANSVSSSMHAMATSADRSASESEEVLNATSELQFTANTLESLVHQFQLRELPQDVAQ
jgi:methyl-accepting chemotaxis protein